MIEVVYFKLTLTDGDDRVGYYPILSNITKQGWVGSVCRFGAIEEGEVFVQNLMRVKVTKSLLTKAGIVVISAVMLIPSLDAQATVFINEVFINPKGDATDANYEFIELLGTPGMKLDGYAVAVLNGTEVKYYFPAGSLPPLPDGETGPEIDELFSLDGLSLGKNGLLALTVREPSLSFFPGLLVDSNKVDWRNLWNGGLDVPGKIGNNGSFTIMLIRNRPGQTEADPCNPAGLLWGKEINHDVFLDPYVFVDPNFVDQWGDGNIDRGEPNGMDGNSLDLTGLSVAGIGDDLEIVDEVSYEDDAGWEYDTDGRHVDNGNTEPNFPPRHVHALDDPQEFNPDVLTRVDYRTKGDGWVPSGNGTGEMSNGNNWQDTATEQWIRGNSVWETISPFAKHYFYDIEPNSLNPVQPYQTNVPLWLDDGVGQDFDFENPNTYEISAGRINPLAVAFIPGDVDRDGDCDTEDITKIANVFGDDNWIFSNSFLEAPETDRGDPNTQTKPWDVDATGDNGIEASDLQWVLNFQGDSTGQIVGIQYDSTTPASSGVVLNSNAGTECTLTTSVNIPSGRTLTTLLACDTVEVTVKGEITAGSNTTGGEENGIMQFVHDVIIDTPGIIKIISVEPLNSFSYTRASLQELQGTDGDLGVNLINGFTTSFSEGLAEPNDLYRITLKVIGEGSANVSIFPVADAKFAASTPQGLKVGHTDSNGDPNSSDYPDSLSIISVALSADFDGDNDVDSKDYSTFASAWLTAPGDDDWNPQCDIGIPTDDFVDFLDLAVLAEQWLAGCCI